MGVRVGIGLFTAQLPASSKRSFEQEYRETLDLVRLEVVVVRVRDEDDVGRNAVADPPRVDVHHGSVALPPERRLPEPRDPVEPHRWPPSIGSCQ
jgi:hypothetical protein